MPFDTQFWSETLTEIVSNTLSFLPVLAGALAWLVLGWIVARLGQFLLANLLRRLGLDRVSERAGVSQFLRDANLDPSVSRMMARLTYWLILLIFVLAAAESLGLDGVANTLSALVAYLPNVLAAALILVIGDLIARLVSDAVGALAIQSEIRAGAAVGQIVRYVLLIFVVILALGQLGIETTLLTTVTIVLITATALALALAFGIGSRDVARNIMAGMHVRENYSMGQAVRVRGVSGRVTDIGTVKTVVETQEGLVSIPNSVLIDEQVTVLPPTERAAKEAPGQ